MERSGRGDRPASVTPETCRSKKERQRHKVRKRCVCGMGVGVGGVWGGVEVAGRVHHASTATTSTPTKATTPFWLSAEQRTRAQAPCECPELQRRQKPRPPAPPHTAAAGRVRAVAQSAGAKMTHVFAVQYSLRDTHTSHVTSSARTTAHLKTRAGEGKKVREGGKDCARLNPVAARTFLSPAAPPCEMPSATASMHSCGCCRWRPRLAASARAKSSMAMASPYGSILSVYCIMTLVGVI